jgi:hypothetical protein
MNGRLNRLYQLRARYDAAVTAANVPRTDAGVIAAGVKLARCQRQFNLELANRRRVAAHTGTPVGVPTQVPTTSPHYLGLILVEQRRIAAALEQLVGHAARMVRACALLQLLFLTNFSSRVLLAGLVMMMILTLVSLMSLTCLTLVRSRRVVAAAQVMRMRMRMRMMLESFSLFCNFSLFLYA